MEYPPQLNPVQAWLLGYIDTATLRDRADFGDLAAAYGRAITDEKYAMALLADAELVVPTAPGDPAPRRQGA